ncbi:MAG: epoxyqueuosine reductase QueH [Kiritimatiellae bacterium]|nr:epoxyqueuosine reductase QueH [Kiritimatiellia bacterium]
MDGAGKTLLHVCCGPCASACVPRMRAEGRAPVLFFANSNLDTEAEWRRRFAAARRLAEAEGVALEAAPYDHAEWLRAVAAGHEDDPEKGERCARCFCHNLGQAAAFAAANGFDGFTTSLTVSPHKPTPAVFAAGRAAGAGFVEIDFKKHGGFPESVRRAAELGLYRQNYCGCEFSRRASIAARAAAVPGVREIARYMRMGAAAPEGELLKRVEALRAEAAAVWAPRCAFARFPREAVSGWESPDLAKHLEGCGAVYLACATLGAPFDAFARKASALSGADALIAQAIGAAGVERRLDAAEDEIRMELAADETTAPRYSPGYGDLPLSANGAVLDMLDAPRRIGVSLTESLQLAPSKSVAAVIGVRKAENVI